METRIYPNGPEPDETPTVAAVGEAVEHAGAVPEEVGGWVRRHLATAWSFTRHLLEMVVAMVAGMVVLGVALEVLGEPRGYGNALVEYGLMGAFMSAPMVAWMRYRGHAWSDGLEMTAAMLAPMFALVLPVELGVAGYVPGLSEQSLPVLSHVAMIGGMVLLMLYRLDRYAHGVHGHDHLSDTTTKETE
jgi:hypothetical protein